MFRRTVRFIARGVAVVVVASGAGALLAKYVADAMHHSVGIEKPSKKQLEEETQENHALFRHCPELKGKSLPELVAICGSEWSSMGTEARRPGRF